MIAPAPPLVLPHPFFRDLLDFVQNRRVSCTKGFRVLVLFFSQLVFGFCFFLSRMPKGEHCIGGVLVVRCVWVAPRRLVHPGTRSAYRMGRINLLRIGINDGS